MARRTDRLLLVYAAGSLAAVVGGCAIASSLLDVPVATWGRSLAAWLVGALLAVGLSRARRLSATTIVWACAALLATTLIGAGIEGVHRWVLVGPVRINLAAMFLPALIALLPEARWRNALALVIAAVLALQPDASQATAFAGAALLIVLSDRTPTAWLTAAGLILLLVVTWFRPDPLQPVAEVEEILAVAWAQAPLLALAGAAALAVSSVSPLLAQRGDTAGSALAVYIALSALMPALGAYPVPLVGMTMSPIVGFWLGVGVLAARACRASAEARRQAA